MSDRNGQTPLDQSTQDPPGTGDRESAAGIFARIQRNRSRAISQWAVTAQQARKATGSAEAESGTTVRLERIDPDADPAKIIEGEPAFPRSTTMRTLIRYPALGLVAVIPVATVLLKSPKTRRTLYRIGHYALEQRLWKQVKRYL
ncbi:MAG: hypothetical protein Q4A16_07415 [Lautropia sp.]|nr:hypothetical protein [Lautropia sp.]